jgi:hypothetical protein
MLPQQSDLSLPDGTISATDMQVRFARAGAVPCAGTRGENCPAEFQKGIAISMWQNSGSDGVNTNWDQFTRQRGKCFGLVPNIMDRSVNVPNSDFWNRCGHHLWPPPVVTTTVARQHFAHAYMCFSSCLTSKPRLEVPCYEPVCYRCLHARIDSRTRACQHCALCR